MQIQMSKTTHFLEVAPFVGVDKPFTYSSNNLSFELFDVITVPFGKKQIQGVVVAESEHPPSYATKPAGEKDALHSVFGQAFGEWVCWLSQYYLYPVGQIFEVSLPPLRTGPKKKKKETVLREQVFPPSLTEDQRKCVDDIATHFNSFHVHLLHGVTGSGKTEIYMQLLEKVLSKKKQGIVLVPEIGLTPQLINRFEGRFPGQVAIIHSQLTARERTNQWWSMVNNEKSILIGTRSALFCPVPNLGAIVIDEEHDQSFKQDDHLKYHARDGAVMRAKLSNIPIVLGTATPSLETWNNIEQKKYHYHQLPNRISKHSLPAIKIIDLRHEKPSSEDRPFWMSHELFSALEANLKARNQSALFLNRRGMAQSVFCRQCGHTVECRNCSIPLTLHAYHYLVCHYCNYSEVKPEVCVECQEGELKPMGLGTEQVEEDIKKLFTQARVVRADRDRIKNKEHYHSFISDMEQNKVDILIGTQMIAKGLDFPDLTLVGLILIDHQLAFPDFRNTERGFQLLTQISGRPGRASKKGQVILQTYNVEHPCLQWVANKDFLGFAQTELKYRREFGYPPFFKLALLKIRSLDEKLAQQTGDKIHLMASEWIEKHKFYLGVKVYKPTKAPLYKLSNKYRFHILIKSNCGQKLNSFCMNLLKSPWGKRHKVHISVDIDPVLFM